MNEAIECYRKAIELDPKDAHVRYELGYALEGRGQMDKAIESYKAAVALDPLYAEAYCNMASALASRGRFAESLVAIKRGHELGSKRPDWRYPSAEWLGHVEATAAMEAKLPAFLKGEFQPGDTKERLGLAEVCHGKKLYQNGTTLFAAAFAADSKVADDLGAGYRYTAACAAALAAAGLGEDAAGLDDKERTRLREQALDWLRADLALRTKQLGTGNPADRAAVQAAVRHWQQDIELASLRDTESLTRLPTEKREAFTQLWADVAVLSKKAAENAEPALPGKATENAVADLLAGKLNAANEHLRAGKPGLAVPLLVEILEVTKARLGPDHSNTLATLNQLGVVLLAIAPIR